MEKSRRIHFGSVWRWVTNRQRLAVPGHPASRTDDYFWQADNAAYQDSAEIADALRLMREGI